MSRLAPFGTVDQPDFRVRIIGGRQVLVPNSGLAAAPPTNGPPSRSQSPSQSRYGGQPTGNARHPLGGSSERQSRLNPITGLPYGGLDALPTVPAFTNRYAPLGNVPDATDRHSQQAQQPQHHPQQQHGSHQTGGVGGRDYGYQAPDSRYGQAPAKDPYASAPPQDDWGTSNGRVGTTGATAYKALPSIGQQDDRYGYNAPATNRDAPAQRGVFQDNGGYGRPTDRGSQDAYGSGAHANLTSKQPAYAQQGAQQQQQQAVTSRTTRGGGTSYPWSQETGQQSQIPPQANSSRGWPQQQQQQQHQQPQQQRQQSQNGYGQRSQQYADVPVSATRGDMTDRSERHNAMPSAVGYPSGGQSFGGRPTRLDDLQRQQEQLIQLRRQNDDLLSHNGALIDESPHGFASAGSSRYSEDSTPMGIEHRDGMRSHIDRGGRQYGGTYPTDESMWRKGNAIPPEDDRLDRFASLYNALRQSDAEGTGYLDLHEARRLIETYNLVYSLGIPQSILGALFGAVNPNVGMVSIDDVVARLETQAAR